LGGSGKVSSGSATKAILAKAARQRLQVTFSFFVMLLVMVAVTAPQKVRVLLIGA
jgi:hypothetical protein